MHQCGWCCQKPRNRSNCEHPDSVCASLKLFTKSKAFVNMNGHVCHTQRLFLVSLQ